MVVMVANRTFLSALLWQKISNAPLTYVWVSVPVKRHDKLLPEHEAHATRANFTRVFRLTPIN